MTILPSVIYLLIMGISKTCQNEKSNKKSLFSLIFNSLVR